MTSSLRYRITASLVGIALAQPVLAQPVLAQNLTTPRVPSDLQVPAGNTLFLKGHAEGTQNYICLPSTASASGVAWTFFSPQATLFVSIQFFQNDIRQQITTHFLSPNP